MRQENAYEQQTGEYVTIDGITIYRNTNPGGRNYHKIPWQAMSQLDYEDLYDAIVGISRPALERLRCYYVRGAEYMWDKLGTYMFDGEVIYGPNAPENVWVNHQDDPTIMPASPISIDQDKVKETSDKLHARSQTLKAQKRRDAEYVRPPYPLDLGPWYTYSIGGWDIQESEHLDVPNLTIRHMVSVEEETELDAVSDQWIAELHFKTTESDPGYGLAKAILEENSYSQIMGGLRRLYEADILPIDDNRNRE